MNATKGCVLLAAAVILVTNGESQMGKLLEPTGPILFEDDFKGDLSNWYHEGTGKMLLKEPGAMRLECTSSRQGAAGCQAFCRLDFFQHRQIRHSDL